MKGLWPWWVEIWDRREHPRSLGMVRILVALVVLWDLATTWSMGLVVPLFGADGVGGIGDPLGRDVIPEIYRWLPAEASTAWIVFGAAGLGALGLLLGCFTRTSAALLLLAWAQLALILPPSDRGIDNLLRNAVLLLALSGAGQWMGVDGWRRHGCASAPGARIASWPRFLLIVQIFILYFTAGMHKVALSWTPMGGWSALYIAMRDPAFARFGPEILDPLYRLTQAATALSWTWEWLAPLFLYAIHCRDTRHRPGRLRGWLNRVGFVWLYLGMGLIFHLGTHVTLRLGIFPFAVLALYPAVAHPDELAAVLGRLATRVRSRPVV